MGPGASALVSEAEIVSFCCPLHAENTKNNNKTVLLNLDKMGIR